MRNQVGNIQKNWLLFVLCVMFSCFNASALASDVLNKQGSQEAVVGYERININTASVDALAEILNGVGPKKAAAIVAHREEHGPFKTIDELAKVNGIGSATIEKNRHLISL